MLLIAGGLQLWRLARWQGWRALAEPMVVILHVGYLWLAVALALIGLSVLAPQIVSPVAALHALTAGAAGVMTLAVMTRATHGHTDRALHASPATITIYGLANLGALTRIAVPVLPLGYSQAIMLSALLWGGAFLLFAMVYGRYLISPRV